MKNQKQTVILTGAFILAGVLSIISYLLMTQFVAFCLQVIGLFQQGTPVTSSDVFSALWQTFGIKLLLPVVMVAVWYAIADLIQNHARANKTAFVSGAMSIVLSAVMLAFTWESFADFPMVMVIFVPALVMTVMAALTPAEKELAVTLSQAPLAEQVTAEVQLTEPTAQKKRIHPKKTATKTKKRIYRRYV